MGVRQLERRLGLGARTLIYHFPQECALITTQYQAYRAEKARKRMEQGCSEVRQDNSDIICRRDQSECTSCGKQTFKFWRDAHSPKG